jgi:hypothetical protein
MRHSLPYPLPCFFSPHKPQYRCCAATATSPVSFFNCKTPHLFLSHRRLHLSIVPPRAVTACTPSPPAEALKLAAPLPPATGRLPRRSSALPRPHHPPTPIHCVVEGLCCLYPRHSAAEGHVLKPVSPLTRLQAVDLIDCRPYRPIVDSASPSCFDIGALSCTSGWGREAGISP